MTGINRRGFVKQAAAASLLMPLGGVTFAASRAPEKNVDTTATLRIGFQEGVAPGADLNEKLDFMETLGVTGLEPSGERLPQRVAELKKALSGRNIQVSAICAGFEGFILATDEAVRQRCIRTVKDILVAAGELESKGLILVPAFNKQLPAFPHNTDTRAFLCEQLADLAAFAHKQGTTLILEPLNRKEAFYLRQVADAASICRDVNSPGLRCMGDFWHMTMEETSDAGAFFSAAEYLQHVHIASRKRRSMPGEDGSADEYTQGFHALKSLGYNGFISFECGCQSSDRKQATAGAVELIRRQWEEA